MNPGLQVHVDEPSVLVHVALLWQLFFDGLSHSLSSKKKFDSFIESYFKYIFEIVGHGR